MKHYIMVMFNIIFLIVSFGFIGPILISAPDTLLVAAGYTYLICVPIILYYINRNYVKGIWKWVGSKL